MDQTRIIYYFAQVIQLFQSVELFVKRLIFLKFEKSGKKKWETSVVKDLRSINAQRTHSTAYSHELLKWPQEGVFGQAHQEALNEILSTYKLQDLMQLFISLVADINTKEYYRRIRPGLCNLNRNGKIETTTQICPKWTKFKKIYAYVHTYTAHLPKIVLQLLGNLGSGKTAFLNQVCNGRLHEEYDPSFGVEFYKQIQLNKKREIGVLMIDSYAQEFSEMVDLGIISADCILVMYDVCSNEVENKSIMNYINRIKSLDARSSVTKSIIIVGTKVDTRDNFSIHKPSFDAVLKACEMFDLPYIELLGRYVLIETIFDIYLITNKHFDKKYLALGKASDYVCKEF
ncbi:hypothetical protein RFI_16267 [Reticulomyxa filosa]|uniref:Ras family small GTPase n=1 Tax=Reticulomyxa filosa TaxID=46433 RepID=X6N6L6_RETFI|nr:hypothetical protein RFI_16267 [Reticulomyxa filosa]|eukprot:ETO20937.1 hypothetical protein RFI_16267 [Reticulomyxa filosa]